MKTETRKEEILMVAARLFRERGFSAVTMRDLAGALHIKAASLYNHIVSKQEILSIIILGVAETFTRGMQTIVSANDTPTHKLEQIIAMHVKTTVKHANAIGCLNNDWMHLEEPELSHFTKLRAQYEDNFRKIVKAGVDQGELRPLNVEVMLFSMLSTLRTLYLWYYKKEGVDEDELAAQMKKVLLKGVIRDNGEYQEDI